MIKNGKVIADDTVRSGDILICDDKIISADFAGEIPADCEVIDAGGQFVSPGFVDIHVHGGAGYDFMDCTEEAFCEIANIHLKNGTTTIVPTTVTADMETTFKMIEVCKSAAAKCPTIYGLHLEGPYLSVNQKGAHNEKLLHNPTPEETARLMEVGKGVICRVTAACELPGMKEFAKTMQENGIALSLGHSDAIAEVALDAFQWGFSHVTHLYSNTPSVRKIGQTVYGGVVEAAYLDDNVTVELVADGKHATVHGMKLALKIKGADKVALITDGVRPAGTDATESYLGEQLPENRIIIEEGVAKLPDRSSFAGSIATMSIVLDKAMNHYQLELPTAIQMMSETPAKILGIENLGRIADGYQADLVFFNDEYKITKVIKNGRPVAEA